MSRYLGTRNDVLIFESYDGPAISIEYWDSGTLIILADNVITKANYLYYDYTPVDYQNKVYPKESEEILVEKINELLNKLHDENKNVMAHLPNDIQL